MTKSPHAVGIDLSVESMRIVVVATRSGAIEHESASLKVPAPFLDQLIGVGIVQGSRGEQSETALQTLGIDPRVPVHICASPDHAALPGAGIASPSTMLMILDPVARFLINSRIHANRPELLAQQILPGYFSYALAPLAGITSHDRATVETAALELRRRIEALQSAGVPVRRFVACGSVARNSPATMQLLADVLNARIKPASSDDPSAIGAAILGALAAGLDQAGHPSVSQLIHTMAPRRAEPIYRPDIRARHRSN